MMENNNKTLGLSKVVFDGHELFVSDEGRIYRFDKIGRFREVP